MSSASHRNDRFTSTWNIKKSKVCLDARSEARLVHRYLAEVFFTKYDGTREANVVFHRRFYQVQWRNIVADAEKYKSPNILLPRLAYAFLFLLALKFDRTIGFAFMGAVTFDAVTAASNDPTSVTFSHTTSSGSDRELIGGIHTFANGSEGNHSSFSYAGSGATNILHVKNNSNAAISLWSKVAPATGANNAVATGITGYTCFAIAITFTGVDQTTPYSGNTSNTGNSNNPSLTVTSKVDAIVFDYMSFTDGSLSSIGADQTQRFNHGSNPRGYGSTQAGAASVVMDWNLDATRQWSQAAVSVDPIVTDLSVNVNDPITVTENITMTLQIDISVNDAVAVAEAVFLTLEHNVSVNDQITVSENISMHIDLNPNVNESITVTDVPSLVMHLGDISVNDQITVTEAVSMDLPIDINVSDSISVSESLSLTMELDINVSDSITVTESFEVIRVAYRENLVHMRSQQQSYPIGMDKTGHTGMVSKAQSYPLGMDDEEIL